MSRPEYRFEEAWPANTGIGWWDESRTKLNTIIDAYNQWQLDGFDEGASERVRAKIIFGIQTFAEEDGGSNYRELLEKMLTFVEADRE